MYRTMEGTHYKNPELAIEAVLNGSVFSLESSHCESTLNSDKTVFRSLKAFIWDSSRLEFEAARSVSCLTTSVSLTGS